MIKSLSFLLIMFFSISYSNGQTTKSEKAVEALLNEQAADWNEGNIEAFMTGYWRSPYLTFIGSNGVTRGWEKTMSNYKRSYPDQAAMGKLRFELIDIKEQSKSVVTVVGKFVLTRETDTLDGHFLLVVKKMKGKWQVVADHTS